jgi:hypothetical protein
MYVNAKMMPVEIVLGIRGGMVEGGEFKYDIFDTL